MKFESRVICSGLNESGTHNCELKSIVRARRQNTDDRVRLAVHADVFADEIAIRVEVLAPESMTENHDVVSARLAFFGKEVASEKQRQSFHREKAGSATRAGDLFGSIVSCDVE